MNPMIIACHGDGMYCMVYESRSDRFLKKDNGLSQLITRLDAIQSSGSTEPVKIIIRGLPGSGKSTLAHYLSGKYNICVFENDHSHMKGLKYIYKNDLHLILLSLSDDTFRHELLSDIIFCDVYPDIDVECSDSFIVVTLIIPKELSLSRNQHKVPESDIAQMCARWKPIEGEILIDATTEEK